MGKNIFNTNKTIVMVGHQECIDPASEEGQAVYEIISGMGLPLTNTYIELVSYGLLIGKCFGIREQRKRGEKKA